MTDNGDHDSQDSDELEAVEALPPASTISALWSALLGGKVSVHTT